MLTFFEKAQADKRRTRSRTERRQPTPRIPVVFHVIHEGGTEDISKEQLEDQIRVLNDILTLRTPTQ